MAVRKKGSRRIVVDGVAYLWRFPHRQTRTQADGWQGVGVTVWREDSRGAVLFIGFPQRFHLSGPVGDDPPRPVLPSDITRAVRGAQQAGWVANEPGPQFVYQVQEDTEQSVSPDRPHD